MSIGKQKTLGNVRFKAAGANGAPTDEQLERINTYSLVPLTAQQVYVRTAYIAHNGIDRDREVFDDALLADFARTLPGKGMFIRHPLGRDGDSGPGQGRWFDARLVEMSFDEARMVLRNPGLQFPPGVTVAKLLEASFYTVRHQAREALLLDIDAGIAGDVSIGFDPKGREPVLDADGKVIAHRWKGPGEALETSIVWLGAQPGARIHKSAQGASKGEGNAMDEKQLKDLQEKVTTLSADLEKLKSAGEFVGEIRKALGENISAAAVIEAARNGIAAQKELIDEIVSLERKQGLVGDSDADVAKAKEVYAGRDIAYLKAWAERLRKATGEHGNGATSIPGGDPNTNRAKSAGDGDDSDGLRNKDVTRKALHGGAVKVA